MAGTHISRSITGIYYSLVSLLSGRGLSEVKDLGPRPRLSTLLSRPRPVLFVLEAPGGRGQVIEDTLLDLWQGFQLFITDFCSIVFYAQQQELL